jgi:hypothetical protein
VKFKRPLLDWLVRGEHCPRTPRSGAAEALNYWIIAGKLRDRNQAAAEKRLVIGWILKPRFCVVTLKVSKVHSTALDRNNSKINDPRFFMIMQGTAYLQGQSHRGKQRFPFT